MKFIHQVEPYLTENEGKAISEYLGSGGWLTEFEKTETFERMIADFLGAKYAVVVTSGTVALYLSMIALDIGPKNSVVVPDYTMIATPNSVKWAGADVSLCDIVRNTLCLDLNKIRLKKNTKALIYVAINGRSGNMEEVVQFCQNKKLFLIEDACQAFGSKWNNRFLGTFGDVGVFSFTPHKIITTGQGGVVITNDEKIYANVKKLKDFCRVKPGVDVHTSIGYNFKFTDLQAVIGIEQLRIIDYRIKQKREIYKTYVDNLSDLEFVEFLPIDLSQTVPWFVDILLKNIPREKFISYIKENGIGSRPFYPPVHSQEPYSDCEGSFSNTSEIVQRGVWLPSSVGLNFETIRYITDTVRRFVMK
jgi:perosamine synthetase